MSSCPRCGNPLPLDARECPQCGVALMPAAERDRVDEEVRELLRAGSRIAAVKRVRVATGVDLRSAKEHVDRLAARMPPDSAPPRTRVSPAGCVALFVALAAGLLWWLQRFGSSLD